MRRGDLSERGGGKLGFESGDKSLGGIALMKTEYGAKECATSCEMRPRDWIALMASQNLPCMSRQCTSKKLVRSESRRHDVFRQLLEEHSLAVKHEPAFAHSFCFNQWHGVGELVVASYGGGGSSCGSTNYALQRLSGQHLPV